MPEISDPGWHFIQRQIDACLICLSEQAYKKCEHSPARPWNPCHTGRILFLSEAPPATGGFWNAQAPDHLRRQLLRLIGMELSGDPAAEIRKFVERDYFLLQSLKWPLKKTFNHFGASVQDRLVQHTARAHLGREIEAILPRAMVVMGKAAWRSCLEISADAANLPIFSEVLGKNILIRIGTITIPVTVTYLPVAQNLQISERAAAVRSHISCFLDQCKV